VALNSIALISLRRRNVVEWIATMEAQGDGEPSGFAGQRIVEAFSRPQIYNRMLQDRDLKPDMVAQHRGSATYVLGRITAGTPGSFTVDRSGRFLDYHGGHGFRSGDCITWFTEAALERGIGWYIQQTYRHGSRIVGRYNVIRIISARSGVEVRKERLRA
jgi:hypothetical protein